MTKNYNYPRYPTQRRFASRGSLLPGKVVEGLPVMALNVNNVDVNFFRVKPESLPAFISQWEYRNSLANWQSDKLLQMADLVYTGRFDLNPARNTRENYCCRWAISNRFSRQACIWL